MAANPFESPYGGQWIDVESRVHCVSNFTFQECVDALRLDGLQKTVRVAVERKMRKIARHTGRTLEFLLWLHGAEGLV